MALNWGKRSMHTIMCFGKKEGENKFVSHQTWHAITFMYLNVSKQLERSFMGTILKVTSLYDCTASYLFEVTGSLGALINLFICQYFTVITMNSI